MSNNKYLELEKKFNYFNLKLNNIPLDVNFINNFDYYYNDLYKDLFSIYNEVVNIEFWLNEELLSLINRNDIVSLDFNNTFMNSYKSSIQRFEFIDDFLNFKNKEYDIINTLFDVYEYYNISNKLFEVFSTLINMLFYTLKTEKTLVFISKLLDFYFSDELFDNETLLLNIKSYVNSNLTLDEQNIIVNMYFN
ncbi:hypothetical protein ACTS9D_06860 [Empedobacter brevis]